MMIPSEQKFPWKFATGVVLLATLVAIVVFGFGTLGTCFYDFKVSVRSASATPIKNVRGRAYYDIVRARKIAANPKLQFSTQLDDKETAFDGNSLHVVGLYARDSYCLGLIQSGSPPHYLVLFVEYTDGKRENKLVEMPKEPGTQRIVVEVP